LHVVDDDVYADWESVYRDNINRLYRLMYARVGNRADAEDLTSEIFSTALPPMRLSASKGEVRADEVPVLVRSATANKRIGRADILISGYLNQAYSDNDGVRCAGSAG
jgi:hypothetical protein